MKKVILAMALVSGLSFANYAQNSAPPQNSNGNKEQWKNKTPAERATHEADQAEKQLGLNADQKSKWQAASLTRINANEPIREKMSGTTTPDDRKKLRDQMRTNTKQFESTINGIMTADQKAKYDQTRSQRKGMHGGKHGHGGPPANDAPPSGQ